MSNLNNGKTENKTTKNIKTKQRNNNPLNDYIHKSEYLFVGIFLNKHIPPT